MEVNVANNGPALGSIQFVTGPLAGQSFQITRPITTIGRRETNDIVIENDPKVSRTHARLIWNNGNWMVEKLAPENIMTVNGQSVQQAAVYENTRIGLGEDTTFVLDVRATLQAAAPSPSGSYPQSLSQPRQSQSAFPPVAGQQQPFPQTPAQPWQPKPTAQAFSQTPAQPSAPPFQRNQPPVSMSNLGGVSPDGTVIAPQSATGGPSIEISSNAYSGRQTYPLKKDVINLGRDASNDIIINDRIVSGFHLQIVRRGSQFELIHPHPHRPQTLNGLLYQGRKIRGDEPFRKVLTRGDLFRIGDENGTLITLTFNDGSGEQQDMVASVQPIKLGMQQLTIGRAPGNDLQLPHPQVSSHHARLVREGDSYRVVDLNSTNHVYVNSELTTNRLLKLGDEIRIGPYRLVYEINQLTQYDESNFIRIDARNLKKSGNNNVVLLNDLSFSIPPRKFVALVGGSGAGKSTLMDALNGSRPAHSGTVLYNGQDYYKHLAAFSTQLGYVPQDDIVHRDLTVERALYYAAKMRLPRDFTPGQIRQRINEVLDDVELTARRKLLVKKLSGGQRKRVSIALELLANPSVLFLDEPTSGLDPGLDRKMMFLLRRLADKGHTIILVTHATNNINTCDYICFLCSGGRLAFFGPPEEAKAYFGKTDFAEIYSSLEPTEENPNVPQEADSRFRTSPEYHKYVDEPLYRQPQSQAASVAQTLARPKRGNPFAQFFLLAQRNLELLRNNTSNLAILLMQAPLIALLLMLLVYFEVGAGIFNANKVVQCLPRISVTTQQAQKMGLSPQQGGVIGPANPATNSNGTIDCNTAQKFLQGNKTFDPTGEGPKYVALFSGSTLAARQSNALQNFITIGASINAQRALFIIAFVAVLFGCINGTREIVKEATIYKRERAVNLGIVPYILSKIAILGILALFQSFCLLIVVQIFEPLQQGILFNPILETYITLALTALAGLMVGLAASAFAANEDSANSLLPFLLIPQVVFAGVEIPLKDWVLQIVAAFFPTRWAMADLGTSIGLHSDKLGGDRLFGNSNTYIPQLFSTYSHSDSATRMLVSWGALVGLSLLLAIVTGIGLKLKDRRG
jgi:ABC-type multidrug transport system ATPase subunit/pSer/pThr/pTyr-binding forkhead associated (FHA) protein